MGLLLWSNERSYPELAQCLMGRVSAQAIVLAISFSSPGFFWFCLLYLWYWPWTTACSLPDWQARSSTRQSKPPFWWLSVVLNPRHAALSVTTGRPLPAAVINLLNSDREELVSWTRIWRWGQIQDQEAKSYLLASQLWASHPHSGYNQMFHTHDCNTTKRMLTQSGFHHQKRNLCVTSQIL